MLQSKVHPYALIPHRQFWRSGIQEVPENTPLDIHTPKWPISKNDTIVTMGSCFAQHISSALRNFGCSLPFFEAGDCGNNEPFNARYGNIYTARHALQLVQESLGQRAASIMAWETDSGFIDPLRPRACQQASASPQVIAIERQNHLEAVRRAVDQMDVLVLTLGLTEAWVIRECGTILPVAPGIVGGRYSPDTYVFQNFSCSEIVSDLLLLIETITEARRNRAFKLLLTVSPIPLTATAESRHVLVSSTYSKATLRAACGEISSQRSHVDYFPSYELALDPRLASNSFEENLRTLKPGAINRVMNYFIASYFDAEASLGQQSSDLLTSLDVNSVDCEDALLEAFSGTGAVKPADPSPVSDILFFGDSHLGFLRNALIDLPRFEQASYVPINFLLNDPFRRIRSEKFRTFLFREPLFPDVLNSRATTLVLVGAGIYGDNILRCFGELEDGFEGCKGSDISPNLAPLSLMADVHGELFAKTIAKKLSILKPIQAHGCFEQIIWIAAPDPPESAARFRFGNQFVDSGAYVALKKAYEIAFRKESRDLQGVDFIFHDNPALYERSGFVSSKYARNLPWDLHPDTGFYEDTREILEKVLK